MKKRILVLAFEYWPMENANTRIIRNLCELLAEHYQMDLVTSRKSMDAPAEEQGSFRVIRVPEYSFHPDRCTGKLTPGILGRMLMEKALGKWTHDETRMLERLYDREVRKAIRISDYEAIVSFSAPILPHACASRLSKEYGIPWIAVCFDPFFSHMVFGLDRLEERKKREEGIMNAASKVLMTYPTDRDYIQQGVSFRDKIIGTDLPGIVLREEAETGTEQQAENDGKCLCCYIGSLYKSYRDPRAAISLFSAAAETVTMRFVGPLDVGTEREEFFPEGCPCEYIGSLSGEALARQYEEADVLVNIGNLTGNFMPSKIFEYIGMGKPIINIHRLPDCPTLKYLEKYPAALNLSDAQIEADPEGCAEQVRAFCRKFRGQRVPAEDIRRLYPENTYEAFAERLRRTIDETLKG